MDHFYHVTNAGIVSDGIVLLPDYHKNKEKVSVFFRALCQGPDIFCATLTSGQYTDAMFNAIKGMPKGPNASKWATEGVFEFVRILHYNDKPPRYNSIYGFNNIELAESFIKENRDNDASAIYRCSIEGGLSLVMDMSLFTEVNNRITKAQIDIKTPLQNQLKEITELSHNYWSQDKKVNIPEILVSGGKVTVIERIK